MRIKPSSIAWTVFVCFGLWVGSPVAAQDAPVDFDAIGERLEEEIMKILNQGDLSIGAWMLLNEVPPSTNRLLLQQLDLNGTGRSLLFVHNSNEIRSYAGGAATGSGVSAT